MGLPCNCQPWLCVQELGTIERPLPAEASTTVEGPNDLGCCGVSCFDYDILAPAPSPSPAAAPLLAPLSSPQLAPLSAPLQAPVQAPLASPSPVPVPLAAVAAGAGQDRADQPTTASDAAPMRPPQPRGASDATAGVPISCRSCPCLDVGV